MRSLPASSVSYIMLHRSSTPSFLCTEDFLTAILTTLVGLTCCLLELHSASFTQLLGRDPLSANLNYIG